MAALNSICSGTYSGPSARRRQAGASSQSGITSFYASSTRGTQSANFLRTLIGAGAYLVISYNVSQLHEEDATLQFSIRQSSFQA